MLTTITPCWGRPEQLKHFLWALVGSACMGTTHLIITDEEPYDMTDWPALDPSIKLLRRPSAFKSIGHYHNLGAQLAKSKWIMKLDVDTLPNTRYFYTLLNVLAKAGPREWFNGGMFYMSRQATNMLLSDPMPIVEPAYKHIMENRKSFSAMSYVMPAGTNFICRREDYLRLGGCDARFEGYGWEDYQQIYMLELHQLGKDPLGHIDLESVTTQCRLLSRRKAAELFAKHPALCLIHRWHPDNADRTHQNQNRRILFEYVSRARRQPVTQSFLGEFK